MHTLEDLFRVNQYGDEDLELAFDEFEVADYRRDIERSVEANSLDVLAPTTTFRYKGLNNITRYQRLGWGRYPRTKEMTVKSWGANHA